MILLVGTKQQMPFARSNAVMNERLKSLMLPAPVNARRCRGMVYSCRCQFIAATSQEGNQSAILSQVPKGDSSYLGTPTPVDLDEVSYPFSSPLPPPAPA